MSGLQYAVNLSSFGAQAPAGTGPISGLHRSEQKLNAVEQAERAASAARIFHGKSSGAISMIQMMGVVSAAH